MSDSPTIRRFVRSAWTLIAVQFVAGLGAAGVTIWAATEVRQLVNQRDLLMTRVNELEADQARRPAAPVEEIPEVTAEPAPLPEEPLPAPAPAPAPSPPPIATPAPPPPPPSRRVPPPRVVRPNQPVYTPPVYVPPPPPPPPPPPEIDDKPPVNDDPPPRRRPRVRIPLEIIGPLLGGSRNPRNPGGNANGNPNNSNPQGGNPTRPPNNSAPPAGQRPSTNDPGANAVPPGSILRRRARPTPAAPPVTNNQQDGPR